MSRGALMLSPVIVRELRIAMRGREMVKSRFRIALMGAGFVAFFLIVAFAMGGHEAGGYLHAWLFLFALYCVLTPALTIGAGLLADERRDRTWELLYLTGIGSGELFIGKLLGAVLVASIDLLALAPLLAVPFLCGGVSAEVYVATVACLPVLLLFILAAGILASAVCTDEGAAQILTISVMAILSFGLPIPYTLGMSLNGKPPFPPEWLSLSPAAGPYMVWNQFSVGTPVAFRTATAASLGWTLLFVILAAIMLKRNWRRDLEQRAAGGPAGPRSRFTRGTAEWRNALRRRLLETVEVPWPPRVDIPDTEPDARTSRTAYQWLIEQNRQARQGRNAFQWLAEQDRRAVTLAWIVIGGVCGVWLLGWVVWPRAWPSCANFVSTALVLNLAIGWIKRLAAARRIGEDRRDGALELLLTTPLRVEEIVDGQLDALKSQFRPIHRTLFALFFLMMWAGTLTRTWTTGALINYFLVWLFLLSLPLFATPYAGIESTWIAINSGRPLYSVMRTYGGPGSWGWLINLYNFRNIFRAFGSGATQFPSGLPVELGVIIAALVVSILVRAYRRNGNSPARLNLLREMRSIAATPVPSPKDPRFKKWKTDERFRPTLYVRR